MWFKKDKAEAAGPDARPLTIDRIRTIFDENEWAYEFDEENGVIETIFDNIFLRFITNGGNLHALTTAVSENLTVDRFPDLMAWIANYHSERSFPTVVALLNQEEDQLSMGADFAIPGAWDYTDKQLMEWVDCGISGMIHVVTTFFEDFDPEFLAKLREASEEE